MILLLAFAATALFAGCAERQPERRTSFEQYPEMVIDVSKKYSAEIRTTKGDFTIELFAEDAPLAVNNFVFLAGHRYFEGIVFHRIVPDFVIQTGDPTGTGGGGPGYSFPDELDSPHRYETGIVAMANAGPDTNGSQFFICTGELCKGLNQYPFYTIFGRVTRGLDTVLTIGETPVGPDGQTPLQEVKILKVTVKEQ